MQQLYGYYVVHCEHKRGQKLTSYSKAGPNISIVICQLAHLSMTLVLDHQDIAKPSHSSFVKISLAVYTFSFRTLELSCDPDNSRVTRPLSTSKT